MKLKYPNTPMRPVVEVLHGQRIVDNYRWLEDVEAPEASAWIGAQNQLTREVLDNLEERKILFQEILESVDNEGIAHPAVYGQWLFYMRKVRGVDRGH